jgi:N-acetylneuraminate synthase
MSKTYIIAEGGLNHNGSLSKAKKIVDLAVKSNADAIKFQIFKTENLVTKNAPKAEYQIKNTKNSGSQYEMLKKLQLSENDQKKLLIYVKSKKIEYLSTPMDEWGVDFLIKNKIKIIKIASGDINNYPLLKKIAKFNLKIILSTGMSTLNEIKQAVNLLVKHGTNKSKISVLHCNTDYPTKEKDVNLNALKEIKKKLKINIGYSDHTLGFHVPIAAVALGAKIIEKHLTIDKKFKGPDHISSLDYKEFSLMVDLIRKTEISLGKKNKFVTNSEKKNINIARKSIVASKSINKGEIFTEKNITIKRPGLGISPMKWNQILKKKAKKKFDKDDLISI